MYVCTVASAALFIQPIEDMKALGTGYLYGFCISLTANTFVLMVEKVEISIRSKSWNAREYCRLLIMLEVGPRFLLYAAASVWTGILHYRPNQDEYDTTFICIVALLLTAHVVSSMIPVVLSRWWDLLSVPTALIPMNYHHISERYGAWVMLMLGESVLGIILEPVEDTTEYYLSFFIALLIVQMLQLTHFSSEEFEAEKHALRRSITAGRLWLELMTVFSVALVALGVGLQVVLQSVVCGDNTYSPETHRFLLSVQECSGVPQENVVLLCGASIVQYITQQIILPQHEGPTEYAAHFVGGEGEQRPHTTLFRLILVKAFTLVALLLLIVVPNKLTAPGLLAVVAAVSEFDALA